MLCLGVDQYGRAIDRITVRYEGLAEQPNVKEQTAVGEHFPLFKVLEIVKCIPQSTHPPPHISQDIISL